MAEPDCLDYLDHERGCQCVDCKRRPRAVVLAELADIGRACMSGDELAWFLAHLDEQAPRPMAQLDLFGRVA